MLAFSGEVTSAQDTKQKIALANYLNNNSPPRPSLKTADQARSLAQAIHFRVFEVVKKICIEEEIKAEHCTWNIRVELRPSFQAYAYRTNEIVVHSGLIDKIASEDELAFVLAHEIAHHILQHVARKRQGVFVGALLGAVTGVGVGTGVGLAAIRLAATSSATEIQADRIAAKIVKEAGYDNEKARHVLIRIAKLGGKSNTRFLDSHPAGLERLMSFDRTSKETNESSGVKVE